MTTRIQREFEFQAGVYHEGSFLMNIYDISLAIGVETDSIREQNIAMERISYYLTEYIENSIFVQDTEKKVIETYTAAGFNVCTLPAEPYDQIVNVMLLTKLNAITEGRFEITDISLGSKLSEGVTYQFDNDSALGPFADPGWWTDVNPTISAAAKPNKKEKIVQLFKASTDWAEIDLVWKEKVPVLSVEKTEITFVPDPVK